jgi:hypothetical protein
MPALFGLMGAAEVIRHLTEDLNIIFNFNEINKQ